MKQFGIELVDAGRKPSEKLNSTLEPPKKNEKEYPRLDIGNGYNSIPIDLEGFKSSDKVLIVLLGEIKEVVHTDRDSQEEKEKKKEWNGTVNILQAGMKKKIDISKASEKEVSGELDKSLEKDDES